MTKIRQYFYLAAGAIAGIIPILVALGGLSSDQATSLQELLTQIGSLLGGGAAVTAGVVLHNQRKTGVVDVNPVDIVIENIPTVVKRAKDAAADLDRIRATASGALGNLPVYGDEAKEIVDSIRF